MSTTSTDINLLKEQLQAALNETALLRSNLTKLAKTLKTEGETEKMVEKIEENSMDTKIDEYVHARMRKERRLESNKEIIEMLRRVKRVVGVVEKGKEWKERVESEWMMELFELYPEVENMSRYPFFMELKASINVIVLNYVRLFNIKLKSFLTISSKDDNADTIYINISSEIALFIKLYILIGETSTFSLDINWNFITKFINSLFTLIIGTNINEIEVIDDINGWVSGGVFPEFRFKIESLEPFILKKVNDSSNLLSDIYNCVLYLSKNFNASIKSKNYSFEKQIPFLSQIIIKSLQFTLPLFGNELKVYETQIPQFKVISNSLLESNILDSSHILECNEFFDNIEFNYLQFKKTYMLAFVRSLVFNNPFEPCLFSQPYFGPKRLLSEKSLEQFDYKSDFSDYGSNNIKAICACIYEIIQDSIVFKNALLIETVRDILLLYFQLNDHYHSKSFASAQIDVVFISDCEYLVYWLQLMQILFTSRLPAPLYIFDHVLRLKFTAREHFAFHVQKNIQTVSTLSLEFHNLKTSFDISLSGITKKSAPPKIVLNNVLSSLMTKLNIIVKHFKILHNNILSSILLNNIDIIFNSFIDFVATIDSISNLTAPLLYDMMDIVLHEFNVFKNYCNVIDGRPFQRLIIVQKLLDSDQNLANIMSMYRKNELVDIDIYHLQRIICAIFEDSSTRRDCLKLIKGSN